MPEKLSEDETRNVLMPITSPRASTSAPPELPGLMAASVWMKLAGLAAILRERVGAVERADDAARDA